MGKSKKRKLLTSVVNDDNNDDDNDNDNDNDVTGDYDDMLDISIKVLNVISLNDTFNSKNLKELRR